jgi:hypothetical protein
MIQVIKHQSNTTNTLGGQDKIKTNISILQKTKLPQSGTKKTRTLLFSLSMGTDF